MVLSFRLTELKLDDGTVIPIEPGGLVLLVGPNNVGKTATLRGIRQLLRVNEPRPPLAGISVHKEGNAQDLTRWMDEHFPMKQDAYWWLEELCTADADVIAARWSGDRLLDLAHFLCAFLDVEKRLDASTAPKAIDLFASPPEHPIHVALRDELIEEGVRNSFRTVFGHELAFCKTMAERCRLHVTDPGQESSADGLSLTARRQSADWPRLEDQGHGMRSFVECLLATLASPAFVHLVDEPEVFLHPPQARRLGAKLACDRPLGRQMVIATHSGDILRGVLDAEPAQLTVVRLTRQGNQTRAHTLDAQGIEELWSDPVLRVSNALDGLFHSIVVICEADADCRFYAAIAAVVQVTEPTVLDTMFIPSGGRDGMPHLAAAFARLGIPTRVIVDFDILSDAVKLKVLFESLAGDWNKIVADCTAVRKALEQRQRPTVETIRARITDILGQEECGRELREKAADAIREVLRNATLWKLAKTAGAQLVPSGEVNVRYQHLRRQLEGRGIFLVECGELERFCPAVAGHGPRWLQAVLQRDLVDDPELDQARRFVGRVLGIEWSASEAREHGPSQTRAKPAVRGMTHSPNEVGACEMPATLPTPLTDSGDPPGSAWWRRSLSWLLRRRKK